MSIDPAVLIVALAAIGVLLVINLLFMFRIGSERRIARRNPVEHEEDAVSLAHISSRLGLLERISGSIDNLTNLFLVPHARGGLGESLLNELLRTWLPRGAFELQHRFANGTRVDAVVKLGEYLVAIDSKFPLEQVRSVLESDTDGEVDTAVRKTFTKHIDDIATKYIRPSEGTLEFALMYIPSEGLYYRAFVDSDGSLMDEALQKRVVPVGPSGLFLYLQTVSFGLQGFAVTGNERRASELIRQLIRDFDALAKSTETTATQMRNAYKNVGELTNSTRRFEATLHELAELSSSQCEQ